jgi:fused signal recognition particle receptor
MEGGMNPELITALAVAGGFLGVLLLFVVAMRRARAARRREIDEAGEGRVARAKPARAALRAEDVVPSQPKAAEEPAGAAAGDDREELDQGPDEAHAEKVKPSPSPLAPPAAPPREPPARESPEPQPNLRDSQPTPIRDQTTPPAHGEAAPAPTPVAPRGISLPVEKPRPAEPPARKPARDAGALAPGLARTKAGWVSRLGDLFVAKREIDPALVDEIEKVLLTADIGVRTSQKLLEEIRSSLTRKELRDAQSVWGFLRERSTAFLRIDAEPVNYAKAKPFVLLTIGVNGSGKTTTIGKLAAKLKAEGRSVLLAAGDTFRAAATEQLETWGARVGAKVVRGKEGGDPSSVIFDAIKRGTSEDVDVVIADTAGRLHTKTNLMEELQKVRRVVGKACDGAPHETWLVIDATSGQNAIAQAQIFTQAMSVTGIVLTKLDGTAKGGVILGIADQLRIPVRYIGVGERIEDLREFDAEEFVEALFDGAKVG